VDTLRQDFMDRTDERLGALEVQIRGVESRLYDSVPGIAEAQRQRWQQDLVELRLRAARIDDQLDHAWATSPDEWKALRETIARDVREIETRVATIADQVVADPLAPEGEREPTGGRDEGPTLPTYPDVPNAGSL
jgi:hypothetical protein